MGTFRLDDTDEFLRLTRFANWNHQTASDFQLRDQRIGNAWPTGRYQDPIIGAVSAPTERAIKSFNRSVVDSEVSDPSLRFTR